MKRTIIVKKQLSLALLAALACTQALATDNPDAPEVDGNEGAKAVLDVVKVTATRREANLLDVPVAVTSIGGEELTERGFRRLNDLKGIAPGVHVPDASEATQATFIRGFGTSVQMANASVGYYLDDVFIPRPYGTGHYGSLPDIERIEILRGPQGTLYGHNTSAGAVRLISKDPSQDLRVFGEISVGERNLRDVRGYLSGSVSDNTSASIALDALRQDGADYNTTLGRDVGRYDNKQIRVITKTHVNDDLSIRFSADYMKDGSDYRTTSPQNVPDAGKRLTFSDIDPAFDFEIWGASLTAEYLTGRGDKLRSITAYRHSFGSLPVDSDALPTYTSGFIQNLYQNQLSQEFQYQGDFDRWTVTAGVIGFVERFWLDRIDWSNGNFTGLKSLTEAKTLGIYAQADRELTERATLTLGGRISHEQRYLDYAHGYTSNVAWEALAERFRVEGLDRSYNAFTPKIGLKYDFNDATMGYVSYARGTTSGGFNGAPGNADVARISTDQSQATTVEGGIKSELVPGRVALTLATYYNWYNDYQAAINNPVINGVRLAGNAIQNAGDAHSYGVELELSTQLGAGFGADLSVGWLQSEFDSYVNPSGAATSNYTGQALPNAPELGAALRLTYTHEFGNGGSLRFNLVTRHASEYYTAIATTREDTKYPQTTYLDGGVSYTFPGGVWRLSLDGQNLANRDYILPSFNDASFTYNKPRNVNLRLSFDY